MPTARQQRVSSDSVPAVAVSPAQAGLVYAHKAGGGFAVYPKPNPQVGYPEAAPDGKLYNAQMAVGPGGQLLANHRKAHLFATDKAGDARCCAAS